MEEDFKNLTHRKTVSDFINLLNKKEENNQSKKNFEKTNFSKINTNKNLITGKIEKIKINNNNNSNTTKLENENKEKNEKNENLYIDRNSILKKISDMQINYKSEKNEKF